MTVTTKKKQIKAISWKSIGKAELINGSIKFVKECLEEPAILNENDTFIKYLKLIAKKDYVLVKNDDGRLVGIITTYDMTMKFNEFLKPFMQIGMIEDSLRQIIKIMVNSDEISLKLPSNKDEKIPKKITDLTFFEYIEIIRDKNNWKLLQLNELDRGSFISHLDKIREIRNKIAHYSPNPLSESEKYRLKVTSEFLLKILSK